MASRKSVLVAFQGLFKSKASGSVVKAVDSTVQDLTSLSIGEIRAQPVHESAKSDPIALDNNIADQAVIPSDEHTAMSDPNTFSIKGLPLSYFLELINHWGGRTALTGLTTTQVCDQYLKPCTKDSGLSLCAQLYLSQNTHTSSKVQDAKWFISHAWKYKFLDVLDALIHFCSKENLNTDETIFWFDLFSNSQHGTGEKKFEWWETVFMNAVKSIGNVVMVLEPWSDPIPLKRVWCIFEVYACNLTNSQFQIAMTPETEKLFLDGLQDDAQGYHTVLSNVHCLQSESWNPADKKAIVEVVKRTTGFAKLDRMVFATISEWLVATLRQRYNASLKTSDVAAQLRLKHSLGCYLLHMANVTEAKTILSECYAERVKVLGLEHPDTLKTMINCVHAFQSTNKITKEETLMTLQCLPRCQKVHGIPHPETLKACQLVSHYFMIQGMNEEAEQMMTKCIKISRKLLGDYNTQTLAHINDLGVFFLTRQKYDEAEALFQEALETQQAILGLDHPLTLTTLCNIAIVYRATMREKKAEALLLEIIASLSRSYGPDHPDISSPAGHLAEIYFRAKRFNEAQMLYQRVYDIRKETFSDGDDGVLWALFQIAQCIQKQGRKREAREAYIRCRAECRKYLGISSPLATACTEKLRYL
ncbi:TPR-like protein [Rhizoclosmatium globosum]|uniref:TPR-like protein n=1 Tax=Rhizoclosmatium globosum TaxID=329046 RepID=A0A1Y2AWW4_9FUNG|nr:TPR-like protein [Rhizoclosmatium globosum]|eukprot:ORY27051.1 TPR-like protein [Rhizoclosmatium globosum]